MQAEALAFVAVGSNLGDRFANARIALRELAALTLTRLGRTSPWYRSHAVGPGEQPDYLNGVVELHTRLGPLELLDALLGIEATAGRVRAERWGPRTLDLDLLLHGDCVMRCERLTLPHPRLAERNFVVYPLADLVPALVLPGGQPLADLRRRLDAAGLRPLTEDQEFCHA